MTEVQSVRQCPYCRESIGRLATRCKYCRSALLPREPAHGGVCPFCREDIRPDAALCRHCGANVLVLVDASAFLGVGGLPAIVGRAAGAGDDGDSDGDDKDGKICFRFKVPDCHIELGEPVSSSEGAGFHPDKIVCDGWKTVTVCLLPF